MILTEKQKKLLTCVGITLPDDIAGADDDAIDRLLLELDDIITQTGFNSDYSLNEQGLILQKLYDEILEANS